MTKQASVLLKILLSLNITGLLFLVLSNLSPYADPSAWWIVALSGLLFIPLFAFGVISLFFWLFVKRKYAIFPLIALALSIPNLLRSLPMNFSSGLKQSKIPVNLRIVTWNVALMNYSAPTEEEAARKNEEIFTRLDNLNADVICMQEMFTAVIPDHKFNFIEQIKKQLGFKYHFFSKDYSKFDGKFYNGTVLFSRYPIVDSISVKFSKEPSLSALKTGILFNGDTIDIISTRLKHINFGRKEEQKNDACSGRIAVLRAGYEQQVSDANTLNKIIRSSSRPVILTGDLNDLPTSYTYREVKGDLHDAWMTMGSGFGTSYKSIYPFLRIDHIFYSDHFSPIQADMINSRSSDHNGVVADLRLK